MENGECPFYESIRAVLKLPVPDDEKKTQLERMGVESTMLNAIHLQLSEKAAAGDVQAAKYLRDTAAAQPCTKETLQEIPEGFDLSALTDEQLRVLAARSVREP